uniref:Uncharacterized protein n=1 Tax=Arundo donax TaxID=35708 RepID=A0A0A8Z4Q1_ARUDO
MLVQADEMRDSLAREVQSKPEGRGPYTTTAYSHRGGFGSDRPVWGHTCAMAAKYHLT